MTEQSPETRAPLHHRLRRFALVGATGFAIDAIVLSVLINYGLDPFSARLIALTASALTTWQLNRRITWSKSADGPAREGTRYFAVVLSAAALNYLVYSAVLILLPGTMPILALIVGTGAAMAFSFIGFDRFAFRR